MQINYGVLKTLDELKILVEKIQIRVDAGAKVGFDVETGYFGPDREKGALDIAWGQQFISGFSITCSPSWARYVPVAHDFGPNLPEAASWEVVKPLLETAPIVCANGKYEIRNLAALDRKERGPAIRLNLVDDTMLQGYVLSEWESVGLKEMVWYMFGHRMAEIQSLFPNATEKQLKALRFNILELSPEVVSYACEDAAWCLASDEHIRPRVIAERKFMYGLEMEIARIMAEVESYGCAVDWPGIEAAYEQWQPFRQRMEQAVKVGLGKMAGRDLLTMNLDSTKQMGDLLYKELNLSTTRMTKGSEKNPPKMSTDAQALEGLSKDHAPIKKLLELREVDNMGRRQRKWVTDYHHAEDGRVHPNFAQAVVGTGRFAANDPPIQQCPKEWRWSVDDVDVWDRDNSAHWKMLLETGVNGHDYWTGNFRDFIISAPGYYLLTYDYSQIELRILAGESQEPSLLRAFENDEDVHTLTAAMMLKKRVEDVDPIVDRPKGKTLNFALLYQMGVKSLAERLGISVEEARELYDAYFAGFSSIATWVQRTQDRGRQQGYVETYFGRKYTVFELQAASNAMRAKGERVLVNAPIQGGAADYMKIAMVRVVKELKKRGWWGSKVTIIMNQHDSLTFEVADELDPNEVRSVIEPCVVFPVPRFPKIVADWELGIRWGSSSKWKPGQVVKKIDGTWTLHYEQELPVEEPIQRGDVSELVLVAECSAQIVAEPSLVIDTNNVQVAETINSYTLEAGGSSRSDQAVEVIIEISEMPDSHAWERFMKVMERPGPNHILLRTPEGELALPSTSGLSPADQPELSIIFSGARVFLSAATVDAESLGAGLSL